MTSAAGLTRGRCVFYGWALLVTLAAVTNNPADAVRPQAKLVPLLKRGALAWTNAASDGLGATGNRLLAHAVDNSTADTYMPAVHRFLRNVKMNEVPFTTDEEVDAALAQELSDRCFYFQEPLSRGKALFFGMLHLAPELGDHLPLSWRCMKTWEKIYPSEEGYAYPRQVIYASLYYLANKGEFWPFVWVWLSYDCYLRTQDAEALLVDDVCDDGVFISLLLSPRARGLKAKTGSDQGVQIDSPLLTAIIRSICRDLRPGERLFPRDRGCIDRAWAAALLSLGLRKPRALHVLRHSGASEDVSSSRRDLEQVRRRGRWSQLKSVARYNKTYMLVKSRAETPAPTLELGDMVEKDLAASLARAACAGGAGKSAHGRAILKALESC